MRILPVIVVYGADLTTCNTYRSLQPELTGRDVLVYDNSPSPLNAPLATGNPHIIYHNDGHNRGVSAAYNLGYRVATERGYGFVLLLDQDTRFAPGYIAALEYAICAHPEEDLFVPNLSYGDGLPFSPVSITALRARGCRLPAGSHAWGGFLPVNSGACIRTTAFERAGGYNEKIRLDFADFDFFNRLQAVTPRFYVIEKDAAQNFSNEETDAGKLLTRYRFYLEGARAVTGRRRFFLHVVRHTLALAIRTRRTDFLRLFVAQYLLKL